jgi:hypothetical protein
VYDPPLALRVACAAADGWKRPEGKSDDMRGGYTPYRIIELSQILALRHNLACLLYSSYEK